MQADTTRLTVIRPSLTGRIGGAFVTALIGALSVFMLGAAGMLIIDGHRGGGAFVIAIAGVMIVLALHVLRDVRAKWGWRIALGADDLDLDLPSGRSLIRPLDPVHARVRYDQIEVIETRLDAYRSFGLANMQRSYALRLKTGELIVLGEDRALGTGLASTFMAETVGCIATHGQLGTLDLGMAEGRGGILAVLFTSPPRWHAPNLADEKQVAVWKRVVWTGSAALLAVVVLLFAAMFVP